MRNQYRKRTSHLNMDLFDADKKRLVALAAEKEITVSEYIRDMIRTRYKNAVRAGRIVDDIS